MKNVSGEMADMLWEQGVIQKDDIEKCKYGIELFCSAFLEIFSILILSVIMRNFVETVVLFVFFIPLRIYAGGYHADTRGKCYLISVIMYAFSYVTAKALQSEIYSVIAALSTVFSLIVVIIKSPIIHVNKNVMDIERKVFRKISIGICLVETTIILLLTLIIPQNDIIIYLTIGQTAVAISMLAAILKGYFQKNRIV